MDDKIKELFEKVRYGAESVGEKAEDFGVKVGDRFNRTLELSKLNMKIFDVNADISARLRALGQMIYDTHRGVGTEDDDRLDALLTSLDAKNAELDALKAQAAELKGAVSCPVCGARAARDSKFCKDCGAPL